MTRKNYSKFSEHFKKSKKENKELNNTIAVDKKVSNATKSVIGVVTGCNKLNLRKEPNKDSESLCVLEKNNGVMVCIEEPVQNNFYKVYTSSGIEGYCVKDYIKIG